MAGRAAGRGRPDAAQLHADPWAGGRVRGTRRAVVAAGAAGTGVIFSMDGMVATGVLVLVETGVGTDLADALETGGSLGL